MGNDFCNQTDTIPDDHDNMIDPVDKDEQRVNKISQNIQSREPSEALAIKVDELVAYFTSQQLTKLQERINKIMKHQKSNHLKLKITKQPIESNQLKDAYFILCSSQIYIGQWVFNSELNTIVPGGIGRLYTDEQIYEGVVKTISQFYQEDILQKQIDVNVNITRKLVRNKQDLQFYNIDTSTRKNREIAVGELLKNTRNAFFLKDRSNQIVVKVVLEGQGRIFSRQKELSGVFKNNKLNGKGICRFREKDLTYQYVGEFKDSKKNGKGLEKIGKLIIYEGDFCDDRKQGSGTLTMQISETYKRERLQEEERILKQQKQVNQNNKIKEISKHIRKVQQFQNQIKQYLQGKKIKWIQPEIPVNFKSMRGNQVFIMDQILKTKFLEKYQGQFSYNEFSGTGTYTWFNGRSYQGGWAKGKMQGFGQFFWPDGTYYRGQYKNDLRHGKGEMIFSFQKRFRGSFAFGLKHGYGELITIQTKEIKIDNKDTYEYTINIKGCMYKNDKQHEQSKQNKAYFKLQIQKCDNLKLKQLKDQKIKMEEIIKNLRKMKNKH